MSNAPFALPLLVLPSLFSIPLCPFDVAKTALSIVTVLAVFVKAVVANVVDGAPLFSVKALLVRNTSANDGAGTLMAHILAVWSHWTVFMSSVPCNRPSDSKLPPKVWREYCQWQSDVCTYKSIYLPCPCDVALLRNRGS